MLKVLWISFSNFTYWAYLLVESISWDVCEKVLAKLSVLLFACDVVDEHSLIFGCESMRSVIVLFINELFDQRNSPIK